ncbi:MAG: 2-succinyl-5-enolpyruvyl-6-hydroxy-3-cyclohexene-1-carboxylic-acid synthase [Actinomycetia bacterium]|nr:2-succinyl-5-enolpyruvyl-6-hydroxy-3-cyclohexene-1-carboxylic-acid synthase [Actinomycetes bacterium]
MSSTNTSARYAAALVGGFADAGVSVAFVSPGSRNTPITIALANESRIEDISIRDERSAGFIALGYAKATGKPAVVSCTSGSAATHYYPAIVEADQSMTPMLILTADRPLRLRGSSAPQTMDQIDLYGSHVTGFVDLDSNRIESARDDATALAHRAMIAPQGPVHANMPFDEPLLPSQVIRPATPEPVAAVPPTPADRDASVRDLGDRSVLIVAGGRGFPRLASAIDNLSQRLRAPVFSDPQVNATGPNILRNPDLIVSATSGIPSGPLVTHAPDVVVRVGAIPTSKAMCTWLETCGVDQILIDESRLSDPLASATTSLHGDVPAILDTMGLVSHEDNSFLGAWLEADRVVGDTLRKEIWRLPFPNEPQIARSTVENLPPGTNLVVASSRPIRDVDAYAQPRSDIRILANRGVNGIDGLIATGLGVALSGQPTALLIGDVAALHDLGSLAELARLDAQLRIIVVNNNGGGIFSFLPQATSPVVDHRTFERHWGTPHGHRISPIADALGVPTSEPSSLDDFVERIQAPICGTDLVEVVTDRTANTTHHKTIKTAIAEALASTRR